MSSRPYVRVQTQVYRYDDIRGYLSAFLSISKCAWHSHSIVLTGPTTRRGCRRVTVLEHGSQAQLWIRRQRPLNQLDLCSRDPAHYPSLRGRSKSTANNADVQTDVVKVCFCCSSPPCCFRTYNLTVPYPPLPPPPPPTAGPEDENRFS